MAKVIAVCISKKRGIVKTEVESIELKKDWGIIGDAHAGWWHRQVSLLSVESVKTMQNKGVDIKNGAFAENILTQGIELKALPIGTKLKIGDCQLELTQIGKECHSDCEIKKIVGMCVMPTDGVFTKVLEGGIIKKGDEITIIDP